MRSIWNWLKWSIGIGPGNLHCWWEDMMFFVQWSDPVTKEVYRLYKCTCQMVENPPDDEDSEEGWDA